MHQLACLDKRLVAADLAHSQVAEAIVARRQYGRDSDSRFLVLRDGVQLAKQRVVKLLRLTMLLVLSLEDEDEEALRQGLGPELQRKLFSAWIR